MHVTIQGVRCCMLISQLYTTPFVKDQLMKKNEQRIGYGTK